MRLLCFLLVWFFISKTRENMSLYLHLMFMPLYKNNIGMKIQGVWRQFQDTSYFIVLPNLSNLGDTKNVGPRWKGHLSLFPNSYLYLVKKQSVSSDINFFFFLKSNFESAYISDIFRNFDIGRLGWRFLILLFKMM